jgi:hypothetical protein
MKPYAQTIGTQDRISTREELGEVIGRGHSTVLPGAGWPL